MAVAEECPRWLADNDATTARSIEIRSWDTRESYPRHSMDAPILPRTNAERGALVAKMCAGVTPAETKPQSLTMILRPYRRHLVAKRREGYSLRQIAACLKASPLQCDVSPSMLKVILAGPAAKRRAKIKKLMAKRAAILAARGTAAPTPATTPAPAR